MSWTTGIFILYLFVLGGIGYYGYKKTLTLSDYYIGGKKLGPWTVALSGNASAFSAWLILGAPGIGYKYGWASVWLLVTGISFHCILWLFTAKRTYLFSKLYDSITWPEFFADRAKDTKRTIQAVSSLGVTIFMVAYVAAQLMGGGKALQSAFGWAYITGLLVCIIIVVGYTLAGGFLAVSLTDVVQSAIMIFFLVVTPWTVWAYLGGPSGITAALALETNANLLSITSGIPIGQFFRENLLSVFFLAGWFAFAQPHLNVRVMASRDLKDLRTTGIVAVIWLALANLGALMLGIAARALVLQNPDVAIADAETAIYFLVGFFFHPAMLGVLTAATLAAMMSSVDSFLLVASSGLVRDFMERYLRMKIEEKKQLLYARIGTLVVLALGLVWAFNPTSVYFLVGMAWNGMGAMFGSAIIGALWWKRATKAGILWSIITGLVVTLVWYVSPFQSWLHFQWVSTPLAFIVLIVVSLLTKPPDGVEEDFAYVAGKGL